MVLREIRTSKQNKNYSRAETHQIQHPLSIEKGESSYSSYRGAYSLFLK